MQLLSLTITGFKSFAKPTRLDFAPGITCVVGPNGCGKSNIVDALRWVLGEQRSSVLRGERMENVIFNGTASRKPAGMADVQITLDNHQGVLGIPSAEVEIARRLSVTEPANICSTAKSAVSRISATSCTTAAWDRICTPSSN